MPIPSFPIRRLCISLLLASAGGVACAGVVKVSFVEQDKFSDAGTTRWEARSNLRLLAEHLEALGKSELPADQTLTVDVLDVDLAGVVEPSRHNGTDIRIVRGRADWPRIHLRYTLESPGRLAVHGEEDLADMNYQQDGLSSGRGSAPLFYEKRMLDKWLKRQFAVLQAGGSDSVP